MHADPRWGDRDRDRKAQSIVDTLRGVCGDRIVDGKWLDVGCGSGGIAFTMAGLVERIDGVDMEAWERWTAFAKARTNLRFHVGACDGPDLPMPEESCDVIICNQVYEHVSDPEQLVLNIHGMLKPGGVCYFAGPNLLWPIEPHVFWPFVHWVPRRVALAIMRVLGSKRTADFDAYLATYWKLNSWFKKRGFQVRNAVPERMRAAQGSSLAALTLRFFGNLPRVVFALLAPIVPSFIFVLRKPLA